METTKNYSQYFAIKTRPNGDNFIACKDEAPQELRDFIRQVHLDYFGGCLPNDWIYRVISQAFDELEENELEDINIEPDCYYSELYKWLGYSFAHEYCNEWIELQTENRDLYAIISGGQYLAISRIYDAVNSFLRD